MPAPPLLALRDAHVTFGGRPTFSGISLAIARGERACLVGRNGSGKSTLLRLLAGLAEPDGGERFQQPGARIAYMPQEPIFDPTLTAAEFVALSLPADPELADRRHLVAATLSEVGVESDRLLSNLSGGEGGGGSALPPPWLPSPTSCCSMRPLLRVAEAFRNR